MRFLEGEEGRVLQDGLGLVDFCGLILGQVQGLVRFRAQGSWGSVGSKTLSHKTQTTNPIIFLDKVL